MEQLLSFESSIYGEDPVFNRREMIDISFWVDRLVFLPTFRPFLLEKDTVLCQEYCQCISFKDLLLKRGIKICPVLIHRLFKLGVYRFGEINSVLKELNVCLAAYYFRNEIDDFSQFYDDISIQLDYDGFNFDDQTNIDLMIEYGFIPSTVEYCLKYDDIETFQNYKFKENHDDVADWNPFEWSKKPQSLDFLSFSGYFGSVKCFKHLIANGYRITDVSRLMVVCSGNTELIHIANDGYFDFSKHLLFSSEFNHYHLFRFFIDQGASIEFSNENKERPLHYAAKNGHLRIVEYLLQHNALIGERNCDGGTPLHLASSNGHAFIVNYLLDHKASVDITDDWMVYLMYLELLSILPP